MSSKKVPSKKINHKPILIPSQQTKEQIKAAFERAHQLDAQHGTRFSPLKK